MHSGDTAFSVAASAITFGPGCLREAGDVAAGMGLRRVALLTDQRLAATEHVATVLESLAAARVDAVVYDEVHCEPTDASIQAATEFVVGAGVDGFVSVGGGSVIDTTKAANLYSTHPALFLRYVNAPVGEGAAPPSPLKPHIACPTTTGTGAECTGIAVFDMLDLQTKTGIQHGHLRPTLALVDPLTTSTLPPEVVASSAFDVLCHAVESYTARPFSRRPAPTIASMRPASQGANPWSDMGCREALHIVGEHMINGVHGDPESRSRLMWAATLAGTAIGNAGCHAPHGMSYPVSGLVRDFVAEGYPYDEPMIPHGMSVVLSAPAVFRRLGKAHPERHRDAARRLGASVAADAEPGDALAARVIELMRATGMPNGLTAVGYDSGDIDALVDRAILQERLLSNAPVQIVRAALAELYQESLAIW